MTSFSKSNQNREICVRTFPLSGMGVGITTSKAESRSVATMRSWSPRSYMSRTLPRAEVARPGKFVSQSTVIAGADDTDVFPLTERRDCSAARREVKENDGGFFVGKARAEREQRAKAANHRKNPES